MHICDCIVVLELSDLRHNRATGAIDLVIAALRATVVVNATAWDIAGDAKLQTYLFA